ncbi:hypothetical protein GC197_15680 [bacterium]|nr:hypothetical protein [bacterium]
MPCFLQIRKTDLLAAGWVLALLMVSLGDLRSVAADDGTFVPRFRIQAVSGSARSSSVANKPAQPKPVAKAAHLVVLQPPPPSLPPLVAPEPEPKKEDTGRPRTIVQPIQLPTPPQPMVPPPNPRPQSPSTNQPAGGDTLPPISRLRGRLSNKPESFFEDLTPEDRQLLYDGKLANQFGIGRTYDYQIDGKKVTPPVNIAAKVFSREPVEDYAYGYHHDWQPSVAMWEAPALYHQPLYFEEVNLERYGNQHRHLQPVYSAAHFFANTLALPYKMGAYPPSERIYTLGYHRPGDWNPYQIHTTPFTWKGVVYTGVVYSGIGAAFPF